VSVLSSELGPPPPPPPCKRMCLTPWNQRGERSNTLLQVRVWGYRPPNLNERIESLHSVYYVDLSKENLFLNDALEYCTECTSGRSWWNISHKLSEFALCYSHVHCHPRFLVATSCFSLLLRWSIFFSYLWKIWSCGGGINNTTEQKGGQ
jgi:hypothetical protein